ncbi:MAG: polymerase sigma-70 factor, subfamily [Tepidanaerobacteraceae bacterium]|nr:polymerase sigma-70 factor, subfamily [Tepidanaerobacteraceae bacterium]
MWQELYRIAFYYLLRLGMSHDDAEDAAQETLLFVYMHLDGIQEGRLKSYVYATAKNKYIDFLRKRKKQFDVAYIDDFCMSSLSEIHRIENKDLITKVISRLSAAEQRLFHMKYNLGMTNAEISSALNITPDSTKTMICRLKNKLKKYLKEEEDL